jgi:hypothetical protein
VVQYLVDDCLILNAGNRLGFAATLRATRHVNVEHPLQFMMTFAALHPQESMLQTGVFKVIGKYLLFLIELWEEQQMTIFFITHDLEEAAFLGIRLLALYQYYQDDRGDSPDVNRGSKIVADHALPRYMSSTAVKHSTEFGDLIQQVREEGFNPASKRLPDTDRR